MFECSRHKIKILMLNRHMIRISYLGIVVIFKTEEPSETFQLVIQLNLVKEIV